MKPQYLVRPHDSHVFELDTSNGCYRSYSTRDVVRSDGTKINAQSHFTLENLTKHHGFFPIDVEDVADYDAKCNENAKFQLWLSRPDGHGGSKGGTYNEYLQQLE